MNHMRNIIPEFIQKDRQMNDTIKGNKLYCSEEAEKKTSRVEKSDF